MLSLLLFLFLLFIYLFIYLSNLFIYCSPRRKNTMVYYYKVHEKKHEKCNTIQ